MQRRRFIRILAASAAGLSLGRLTGEASPVRSLEAVHWRGYALGAEGQFTLYTDRPARAREVLERCFAEVQRLESIFSLYDHHSELCRLNREGGLADPSGDWGPLLETAAAAHQLSGGAFDPTVGPLWALYAEHFKNQPDAAEGPGSEAVEAALSRTGWEHVNYTGKKIAFARPGMQLTFNGIAQGFITDRVADFLQAEGYKRVLVELGETRALGRHPKGRPWRIGIKDAADPAAIHAVAELEDRALATSGGYGSPFSKDGRYHHLIDPRTGRPETRWRSLSVLAPTAAEADALSTGLSFATAAEIRRIEAAQPRLSVFGQGLKLAEG